MVTGRNSQGVWYGHVHTAILKWIMNKVLLYRGLCSMLCGSLKGREIWWRMDTCICVAESLCCACETITTLLFGCCCLVTKSCPALCDLMDCSTPGFPVLHYLPEFAQTQSIESVMLSNHLILCHSLLLLPSIFPSIRIFSKKSAFCISQPKYWSFIFSISLSNEYSGLISFRINWLNLLAVQGTLKSLLQHSQKASILQCSVFFMVQFSHPWASLVAQMVKNLSAMQKTGFDPWVEKILWSREWLPTPVFLPGEFHGQRSLAGYSPWDHKESDTTE